MGQKLAESTQGAVGTHPLLVKCRSWGWWASFPLPWNPSPKCRAWEAKVKPTAEEVLQGNQSNLVSSEILKKFKNGTRGKGFVCVHAA